MDQKQFARHLRQCQNSYEALLWQLLRNRRRCNKKFRRQYPIGVYTADFYCAEEKLVIEIDGRGHFTEQGKLHDEARDRFMRSQGIRVLRFTGKQVETETVGSSSNRPIPWLTITSPSSPDPFSPSTGRRGVAGTSW